MIRKHRALLIGLWFCGIWLLRGQQGDTLPTLAHSPGNGATNVSAKSLLQWQWAGFTNLLKNGRFTEGLTNWSTTGIWVASADSGARSSGSASVEVLSQELELPADAVAANAAWDYGVPPGRLSLGLFQVEVRDLNDVRLALLHEVSFRTNTRSMTGSATVDLTPWLGRRVRLAFVVRAFTASVRVQNVSVQATRGAVEFAVRAGPSPELTDADVVTRTRELKHELSRRPPGVTNYWQVLATADGQQHAGPVVQFSTAPLGPLAAYEFNWGDRIRVRGEEVPLEIVAVDAKANLVTTLNTNLTLRAFGEATVSPTVLFTEFQVGQITNAVEVMNVTAVPVDLADWQLLLYDLGDRNNPRVRFRFPSGSRIEPGTVASVRGWGSAPGTSPDFRMGTDPAWSQFGTVISFFAAVLVDPGTNVVDFAAFGRLSVSNIAGLFRVPAHQWRSAPVPMPWFISGPLSWHRAGRRDANDALDWAQGEAGLGTAPTAMELPLQGGPGPLTVTPDELSLSAGVWQGRVRFDQVGTNVILSATNASSVVGRSASFNVQTAPYLVLTAPKTLVESAGSVANALRLVAERAPERDVLVRLAARPDDELALPLRLNWPAGIFEWRLPLTPRDTGNIEGPRSIEIYAEADGFVVVPTQVMILDDELVTLRLEGPAEVDEQSTNAFAVTLSAPAVRPLALHFSVTGAPGRLRVPVEVIVPAGSTRVAFAVEAMDDGDLGPAVTNLVIAAYPGNPGATLPVVIRDNESRNLMLSAATNVFEGGAVQTNGLRIQVAGVLRSALTVQLASSDTNRVRLPATVVLPAGVSEVAVALTNMDNTLQEGPVSVMLQASAEGFTPAEAQVIQQDNDPAALAFGPIASPQVAGNSFPFSLRAVDPQGRPALAFSGTVLVIQSPADGGNLIVTQQVRFVNGLGTGTNVAVGPQRLATLRTTTAELPTGVSSQFNVVAPFAVEIPISDARDLRVNATRNRLYVSVGAAAAADANSIVEFEPDSFERLGRIDITEPIAPGTGIMAVTDDGSMLFVATGSGEFKVVRMNLNSRQTELTIPLRDQFGQFLQVTAMELGPEAIPEPRVILNRFGTRSGVISGGTLRNQAFPPLVFMDRDHDTGVVYGRNIDPPHPLIYRLNRVPESPLVMRTEPDYPANRSFAVRGGRFFQPDGTVLELATGRQLARLDVPGIPINYSFGRIANFLFSKDGRRLGIAGWETGQTVSLRVFAMDTWELLGVFPADWWPVFNDRIVPLPGGRFACIYNDGLRRLDLPQLDGSAARMDLGLSLASGPERIAVGDLVTNRWRVVNQGTNPATDIQLLVALPGDARVHAGPDAWIRHRTQTNTYRADCVNLDPGEVREFEFIWSASESGPHPVLARAVATELELTPADNGVRVEAFVELPEISAGVIPLSWAVNDLVYGAGRQRAYATGTERGMATVWELDPVTGRGTELRRVVAPAGRLGLSRDHRFLYVAIAGAMRLLRVDLNGVLPDLEVPMGTAPNGQPLMAREFRAVPGQPESVAVFRAYQSPTPPQSDLLNFDLVIFDGAVMRPKVESTSGQYTLQSQFEFSQDSRQVFATGAYDPGILVFAVTAEGLSLVETRPQDPSLHDWRHFDGRLFATDGRVFDPVTLQVIARLPGLKDATLMDLAPERGRAIFFDPVAGNLHFCDLATLMAMALVLLPDLTYTEVPRAVRDFGPGQAAVITREGRVLLVRSPALRADGLADVSVRPRVLPASIPMLAAATFEWEVSNAGPGIARSVTLQIPVPEHVRIDAVTPEIGTAYTNRLGMTAELGDLAVGEKTVVTVILTPLLPIALTNIVTVAGGTGETVPADNRVVRVVPVTRPTGPDDPRVLELAIRDLLHHAARGLLYAAVAGNPGFVQPIRPETGELLAPLAVQGPAGQLRLSADGRFLFVGRTNRGDVVRLDLDNGNLVPFSAGPEGQFWITAFEADPTDSDSLITVVQGPTGGIWRITPTGPVGSPLIYASGLLADREGQRVLAWGIHAPRWLRSAPEGLVAAEVQNGLDGDLFVARDGRAIPTLEGTVTDFETLEPVGTRDGYFNPLVRLHAAGPMDGDLASGRILMVRRQFNPTTTLELVSYDWHSLAKVRTEPLHFVLGEPRQLVRWGSRGLALHTDADELFLWETGLIPAGPATDLRLEAEPAPPGVPNQPVQITLKVRNAGNEPAINVVVGFMPSRTATFEVRLGGEVVSDADQRLWRLELARLAPGETATAEVVASYRNIGSKEITAHVTSSAHETAPDNNHLVLRPEIRIVLTRNSVADTGLQASDLAYEPGRRLLHAASPAGSLFSLNPFTGLSADDFPVPGGISRFVLADDGSLAHVLNTDLRTVRLLDLATGSSAPEITIAEPWAVTDLLPVPGRPEAVILSLFNPNEQAQTGEIALFVNGVRQPAVARIFAGRNRLHYGSDGLIYGTESLNAWPQELHLSRMRVTATGLEVLPNLVNRFDNRSWAIWGFGGHLINDRGEWMDLATGLTDGRLEGTVDGPERLSVGHDAPGGRLLVLGNSVGLSIYDAATLQLVARGPAASQNGADAVIVRCGGDRVATLVRNYGNGLSTIHLHRLDGFPLADLSLAATAPAGPRLAGDVVEFQLTLTNRGPAVATNTGVLLQVPGQGGPLQPHAGTVAPNPAGTGFIWLLPRFASGEFATLRWSGRATNIQDGSLTLSALAESLTEDPAPENNQVAAAVDIQADNDRDSLPDWWETAHGLDPWAAADPSADADGDGYNDTTEFVAGTDPGDSADAPRLLVERVAGELQVSFHAVSGRTYQVEARSEVAELPWQPVGWAHHGTGQTVAFQVPPPVGGTAYWRLVIQ